LSQPPSPDWKADNETTPVHSRWMLGWAAPAAVGPVPELLLPVSASLLSFLRWDFQVGTVFKGDFIPPGTPAGPPAPPLGSDLVLDLLVSHDHGTTFASMLTDPSDRPRLPAGKLTAVEGYFVGPVALSFGDQLTLSIIQVGSTQPGSQILFSLAGYKLKQ
jgi:hypothetical protein